MAVPAVVVACHEVHAEQFSAELVHQRLDRNAAVLGILGQFLPAFGVVGEVGHVGRHAHVHFFETDARSIQTEGQNNLASCSFEVSCPPATEE